MPSDIEMSWFEQINPLTILSAKTTLILVTFFLDLLLSFFPAQSDFKHAPCNEGILQPSK